MTVNYHTFKFNNGADRKVQKTGKISIRCKIKFKSNTYIANSSTLYNVIIAEECLSLANKFVNVILVNVLIFKHVANVKHKLCFRRHNLQ